MPWEIERLDEACLIPIYGRIEHALDRNEQYNPMWMDWQTLIGTNGITQHRWLLQANPILAQLLGYPSIRRRSSLTRAEAML